MREELDNKLFTDFPLLYNKYDDLKNSCMSFGFECGDGWYELIRELSEKLVRLIKMTEMDLELPNPKATQVKEKYGSLRFYMSWSTDAMEEVIREYEERSEKTCEVCGKEGSIDYKQKWLSCRCQQHRGK